MGLEAEELGVDVHGQAVELGQVEHRNVEAVTDLLLAPVVLEVSEGTHIDDGLCTGPL